MYEIGYKAIGYYRDATGCRILAKYKTKDHYHTEEEAEKHAESEFPKTLTVSGVTAHRCEVEVKAYKYPTDTCPDGYCVCPRCGGTGVYGAPSRYHDQQGVKFCFKCDGWGMVKTRK